MVQGLVVASPTFQLDTDPVDQDINPQRCRRLIFPEVGAIEPYSDRGFVVIDFQRERLELYSSNPRSTSMSRFIEQVSSTHDIGTC